MACRRDNGKTPTTLTTLTNTPGGVIGRLLAAQREGPPPPPLEQVSERGTPTAEEMLAMSYEQFARATRALALRSACLGEDIVPASDEAATAQARTKEVVDVLDESRHLYASGELNVEALMALHRLKRGLRGARARGMQGPPFSAGGGHGG